MIHAGAFKIYFAAVVMVLGGVSLLTNQKLYRFLVKPRFEFVIFSTVPVQTIGLRNSTETADCLDDFETSHSVPSMFVFSTPPTSFHGFE